MSGTPDIKQLVGNQREAVDPQETVWLSASAGTGKTHVLTSRVLRLLLQPGVEPSQILCLTFTKAGAAEMAVRVNQRLAAWVRMPDDLLYQHLEAIGADPGPEARERARTLFASVLDCPGGGLRIDTIHAFAQWLLSAFPEEAGLVPGTRAMEDRERDLLFGEVLADVLETATREGDTSVHATIADLSLRKGPDAVEGWLSRCASAIELWRGPGGWQAPMRERVNVLLGLKSDASEADLAELCSDDVFDVGALRFAMEVNRAWSAKTGQETAAAIEHWLGSDPAGRAEWLDDLYRLFFTTKDELRASTSQTKIDPSYPDYVEAVAASLEAVREFKGLLNLTQWLTPALELGRKFALVWEEAKTREGLIDFDDQIRRASDLLTRSDLSDWIRFKLDRQFDHILVDEAQDTNEAQWRIILEGLCSEFFSGRGQRDDRLRTLFVVGDYKQAIFRFQGTSPENFEKAKLRVKAEMDAAAENARASRENVVARTLKELGLGKSFRSSQSVLSFVDNAISAISYECFGLKTKPDDHEGSELPGLVTLWPPIPPESAEDLEESDTEEGKPTWLQKSDRKLADKLARQVKSWLDQGYPLAKQGRNANAGDIMVLVRKRKDIARLIVARLHAHGVPVAGVDRLRLGGPLAVQDLMAALRFAAQPLDDLNLACLLVSPLVGWSQEELLDYGWRPKDVRLWVHLRESGDGKVRETLDQLGLLLALADYEPPQSLLHWLLVGPWQGRRKLLARLGREANDPIDELLNAALAYSSAHTPSLQGFIKWFDTGDSELKREQGTGSEQVRVMTVHGSKGLESPIVILADAAGNPDDSRTSGIELAEQLPGGESRKVPLPGLTKEERLGRIREAQEQIEKEEREEHWRLLYVAMTRAEQALYIGGSLNKKEADGPKEDSWFARLKPLFPANSIPDKIWTERWEIGTIQAPIAGGETATQELPTLPAWAATPVGPEPRPPRPLAPSSAGEDQSALPPLPSSEMIDAARRGTLVHRLLERLPELPIAERAAAAERWLAAQAGDLLAETRAEMAASALAVLDTPDWAEIFTGDALAEVPLAAIVDGQVVAGTADRLLVQSDRVLVVDLKTAARPPQDLSQVPLSTLRQMAAYAGALGAIYPGRRIEAAVLYTSAPRLIPIPQDLLAEHKRALAAVEESF